MELAFQVSQPIRRLTGGHLRLSSNSLSVRQGCYFCVKQYALECSRIPMGQTVNSQVGASKRNIPAGETPGPWRATVLPGFLTFQPSRKKGLFCLGGWKTRLDCGPPRTWSLAQVTG